ncbi:MAG: aminopeptidase N [Geobacteraceae bacterium]
MTRSRKRDTQYKVAFTAFRKCKPPVLCETESQKNLPLFQRETEGNFSITTTYHYPPVSGGLPRGNPMTDTPHATIYRKDYTPPDYLVDTIELRFELGEETTRVQSRLSLRRNPDASTGDLPLRLDGHRQKLLHVALDGTPLGPDRCRVDKESLSIPSVPSAFTLEVTSEIRPQDNTFLEGLYRSNGMFCTQCEPEGFRSITYFPDRPDVLSVYTVTIVAEQSKYPLLLANGNPVESGTLDDGLHYAVWHDPFPKPCYLFALVAGDLHCHEGNFTTCSGREVTLRVFVEHKNRDKGWHALRSLQKAMRWDEEQFGREYDLDLFMIVAVDDFNMGAMENKGLNIFNSRYVLACPKTATDDDFQAIEEVVGHEYFHNWSGNRVTCRDWFQLSLKEGLTIFRDQEFSADMESRGVKRIADVRLLRTNQFPEDGGPMAHPVRPDSYMEINNFYTMTVYHKGAELIRMIRTLLGAEKFRAGMDLYFASHDGKAVTVEDFVKAMEEGGKIDLRQFRRWYAQSGTPRLNISGSYDPAARTFTLTVRQSCPPTPGQPDKEPYFFPLTMGLLGRDGQELPCILAGETVNSSMQRVLKIKQVEETFVFTGLTEEPVPALLRGFSAPVRLSYPWSHENLTLLMAHETDPFCRWEAGQQLAVRLLLGLIADLQAGKTLQLDPTFASAFKTTLTSGEKDRAFLAEALTLPSEAYLAEQMEVVDPDAIHQARQFVRRGLAEQLRTEFLTVLEECKSSAPYAVDDGRAGERRLANLCLAYLMTLEDQEITALCLGQFRGANNMTDVMGALIPLASCDCPERRIALDEFYASWQDNRQVVDKWFSVQASSTLPGTIDEVTRLLEHPAFALSNPNRFRSLVGVFSQANQVRFHAADGSGYRYLGDQLIRLIPLNPQVAARLLTPLTRWKRYRPARQALMIEQLRHIEALPDLPRDVFEVVEKSLADSGPLS